MTGTPRSLAIASAFAFALALAGCGSGKSDGEDASASASTGSTGGSASAASGGSSTASATGGTVDAGTGATATGGTATAPGATPAGDATAPAGAAVAAGRGTLLGPATPLVSMDTLTIDASLESQNLAALVARSAPCNVTISRIRYRTIGGAGEPATAAAAVMTPSGTHAACSGPRPVVLYARGTSIDRSRSLTDPGDGETASVIAFFAGQGMIVVAPSYAGHDGSDLPYHPYLNAQQQSADMIDALRAARVALPALGAAPSATLFVTGYSQGGHVAMATHRAIEQDPTLGITVTASAPMSGPYALTRFLATAFAGTQPGGGTVYLALLLESYQRSYGNVYSSPAEVYARPYDTIVPGLLPTDDPVAKSLLPPGADGTYRSLFDVGDGQPYLLTSAFRARAMTPTDPFMADVQRNDLLGGWAPRAPMALCHGSNDPVVFGFNSIDAQAAFTQRGVNVLRYDLEDASTLGPENATLKRNFDATKALVRLSAGGGQRGETAVAERYHAGLVAPYCLSLVQKFFDQVAR